jgi:hypothetical protein
VGRGRPRGRRRPTGAGMGRTGDVARSPPSQTREPRAIRCRPFSRGTVIGQECLRTRRRRTGMPTGQVRHLRLEPDSTGVRRTVTVCRLATAGSRDRRSQDRAASSSQPTMRYAVGKSCNRPIAVLATCPARDRLPRGLVASRPCAGASSARPRRRWSVAW